MKSAPRFQSLFHPFFFVPAGIGLALVAAAYVSWDRSVAWFFFRQTDPRIEEVAGWVSEIGTVVRPEVAVAIWLVGRKRWPRVGQAALFFVTAMLGAGLLNLALKAGFGRCRPEMLFEENAWGFRWFESEAKYWAFPSGHTASAMGAMTVLMLLFPRGSPLFLLQAVLVGISRVALREHYVSDVIAGGIVGAAAALAVHDLHFREALRRVGWRRPRADAVIRAGAPGNPGIQG